MSKIDDYNDDYNTVIAYLNAKEYARQMKFEVVTGGGGLFHLTMKGKSVSSFTSVNDMAAFLNGISWADKNAE